MSAHSDAVTPAWWSDMASRTLDRGDAELIAEQCSRLDSIIGEAEDLLPATIVGVNAACESFYKLPAPIRDALCEAFPWARHHVHFAEISDELLGVGLEKWRAVSDARDAVYSWAAEAIREDIEPDPAALVDLRPALVDLVERLTEALA